MPGKQARALCPVCREAMPPDETECQNCGAFVIDEAVVRLCRAFGIGREKALQLFEAGFRHPTDLRGRRVEEVLERRESGLLFICTNCGSFVATGDARCPRCAAEFEEGEEAPTPAEEDILDLVLCPNCGADNGPQEVECEICGESLRPPDAGPAPVVASRAEAPGPPAEPAHADLEKVDLLLEDLEPTKLQEPPGPPSKPAPAGPVKRPQPGVRRTPASVRARAVEPARPVAAGGPASRAPMPVHPPSDAKPVQTRAARTAPTPAPPRPIKHPAEIRVARTRRTRSRRTGLWTRAGPPPEYMGPAVAASAAGLYMSWMMEQPLAAWAIAFALAAFSGYAVAASYPSRTARLRHLDATLLTASAVLAWAALVATSEVPGVSVEAASLLAIGTAVPLGWTSRRIVRTPARPLIAAASGVALLPLAVAAGQGLLYAAHPAWVLGLVAAWPWPIALTAVEVRARLVARATRRELLQAEHDYARRDYAKTLEDYDRAIALSEKGAGRQDLPWYGKGATLVLLGQYEEALRAIDRALDINPRNEVAWVNKGNALTKMGRVVDALRSFNAALKVNPRYEVAWNNKGNALARLGRYDEALRCYEKALEIDEAYRGAWVNKGYVLAKLGRYDEAAGCADRVLRLAAAERVRAP